MKCMLRLEAKQPVLEETKVKTLGQTSFLFPLDFEVSGMRPSLSLTPDGAENLAGDIVELCCYSGGPAGQPLDGTG